MKGTSHSGSSVKKLKAVAIIPLGICFLFPLVEEIRYNTYFYYYTTGIKNKKAHKITCINVDELHRITHISKSL